MVAEIDTNDVFSHKAYLHKVDKIMNEFGCKDGECKGLLFEDYFDQAGVLEFLSEKEQLAFYDSNNKNYYDEESVPDIRSCDKKGWCGLTVEDTEEKLSFEQVLEKIVERKISKREERKKVAQDNLNKIKSMSDHELLVEIYLILKNGKGEMDIIAEAGGEEETPTTEKEYIKYLSGL